MTAAWEHPDKPGTRNRSLYIPAVCPVFYGCLRLARGGFSLSSGFKSYERLMVCQRAASGLPDYGSAPATVGRWSSRRERPAILRVKRSRASAPHRREPPGTGDALRMKSGHESETTRAGHNVRRVASVQFSAPHVDIRFEKLHDLKKTNSCGFSSSMSNSHLKCPTHVQLDTRVRQTRWIKIVETPGRSSTGLCTDGIRALVLSRSLEPRIAPGS